MSAATAMYTTLLQVLGELQKSQTFFLISQFVVLGIPPAFSVFGLNFADSFSFLPFLLEKTVLCHCTKFRLSHPVYRPFRTHGLR